MSHLMSNSPVLKQLSTGAYANAKDVVRHALEELDVEEWTPADCG